MIKTKKDLRRYLAMDRYAQELDDGHKVEWPQTDIWKFQKYLRHHEYYNNIASRSPVRRLLLAYYRYKHNLWGRRLGFEVPINVFGAGLRINHIGYLVVNPHARIGKYCDIHQGVNIGQQGSSRYDVPTLGDNVWIGPGAKLFGRIHIPDDCQIGANAVVNKSVREKGVTIAGVPARKITDNPNPYKRNYFPTQNDP